MTTILDYETSSNYVFPADPSKTKQVQAGLGTIENDDLSDKFRSMAFRFEFGRANEPLFFELHGFHPTQYSHTAQQYQGYRYVSLI